MASDGGWKTASLGLERKQQGRQAVRLGAAWGAGRIGRRGRETSTGSQQPCGQLPGQQAAALGEEGRAAPEKERERARCPRQQAQASASNEKEEKKKEEVTLLNSEEWAHLELRNGSVSSRTEDGVSPRGK